MRKSDEERGILEYRSAGPESGWQRAVRRVREYFAIEQRHASLVGELRGGFVTFLSMSYILFVNPRILSQSGMNPVCPFSVSLAVSCCALLTGVAVVR
jgi:adenine/guanine/hypoxanthine permease